MTSLLKRPPDDFFDVEEDNAIPSLSPDFWEYEDVAIGADDKGQPFLKRTTKQESIDQRPIAYLLKWLLALVKGL